MVPLLGLVLVFPKQSKRLLRTRINKKHFCRKNYRLRQLLQDNIRRVANDIFVTAAITVVEQFRTVKPGVSAKDDLDFRPHFSHSRCNRVKDRERAMSTARL